MHHENVLQLADGSWRAIDPKGLQGEHYFDYVLALANPSLPDRVRNITWFQKQRAFLGQMFELDTKRLTAWVKAYLGLSIFWFVEDGMVHEAENKSNG